MSSESPPPSSRNARPELAAFLRGRRARVQPTDVGLPTGPRRRTPGLRREEVAQLADVGASWYTWLEQGREIQVSEGFLERLAHALRLTAAERAHLFELAQGRAPRRAATAAGAVSEPLRQMIAAHPYPALVTTPRWDILAWNAAAVALFGELDGRNAVWLTFMEPAVRARFPHWEPHARRMLARFRLDAGRAADRAEFDALVAQLSDASAEFRTMWREHDVFEDVVATKVVVHADVGEIELDYVTLVHAEPDGRSLRVTFDVPRPGISTTRARQLFGLAP